MYILWIFLFCRWVTDFKNKLVSGEVPSLTKAKDIATVHWRNYSTQYDSKRAVQQPTANRYFTRYEFVFKVSNPSAE
jgi:hypothetical protein